jgi:hypothetical protein
MSGELRPDVGFDLRITPSFYLSLLKAVAYSVILAFNTELASRNCPW